jgi:septum formation protein
MLKTLSGNVHEVVSAVYVCSKKFSGGFTSITQVEFYDLSDKEIWDYVKTGDGSDKAGSYGIQSKGITLVKGINGDYYNVVGFPAAEFVRFMEKNGL